MNEFQVRRIQARIQKAGIMVSSTEWTIDKQLEAKDLHPTVVKFCAGFSVYRLKEVTKDSWKIEEESGSGNGKESEIVLLQVVLDIREWYKVPNS